ncbi:MAG: HAMP domain-containing sensor histidine kinase [Acidobacteriota bacterium]
MRENLLTFAEPTRGLRAKPSRKPSQDPTNDHPSFETLGRLVAEIAHEARNPLASILAGLEAWTDEPEAPFDLYGVRIQRDARRLALLMDCLLELARPSRQRREAVAMRSLVKDVIATADLALLTSQVELQPELCVGDAEVAGDPAALRRMIQNLLDNAIQHTAIEAAPGERVVRLALRAQGGSVVLSIQDRGPGFAPDELARAFEPFFSRRRGGSGLGLSIVQKVVAEHKGQIALRNRKTGGAVARVTLPAHGSAG